MTFNGQFTQLGRRIATWYFAVFVLGLIITHWLQQTWMIDLLLHPFGSSNFHIYQFFTHLFIWYPQHTINFLLYLLMFWLFAWQIEQYVGKGRFLFMVFGIPWIAGIMAWPLTAFFPSTAVAGFSMAIDVLLVGYCMMNRNATIHFWFLVPLRAEHMIVALVLFQLLTFLAMENPRFVTECMAIALTYGMFRYNLVWDPQAWYYRFKARWWRRKRGRYTVIQGGSDRDDSHRYYH